MIEPIKIIVIGDIITDTIVQLQTELVKASDTPSRILTTPGGSAANQAVWLAVLGGQQLEVNFVGRVGQDIFGLYHRQELEKHSVKTHLSIDPEQSTGQIVVLVEPDGERHMLTERGANTKLAWEDVPQKLFQPGAHFHLSGYTLQDVQPRQVALQALALARQQNMLYSVDPSSTSFLQAVGVDNFLNWTAGASFIFPNREEGQFLSGKKEPAEIAQFLTEYYDTVVLKLGAEGALLAQKNEPLIWQPTEKSVIVDTTGAGDAFCAGFLHAYLTGKTMPEALLAAVRIGTHVAGKPGSRPK